MENLNQKIHLEEVELKRGNSKEEWKGNIIIFPGGGYHFLSPRESKPIARAFALANWKPWILSYTVSEHGEALGTVPLEQAAGAVEAVHKAYPEKKVILCGFSAGGHAAASLGVHWKDELIFPKERQEKIRPDGLILCYPVITSGEYAHERSMELLAGKPGDNEKRGENPHNVKREYFSLENYVDAQTPPVFLWHTAADRSVAVQNTLLFAEKLAENKVPFELHIYPYGNHGMSLATKEVEEPKENLYPDAHIAGWFKQCIEWLDHIVFPVPHL